MVPWGRERARDFIFHYMTNKNKILSCKTNKTLSYAFGYQEALYGTVPFQGKKLKALKSKAKRIYHIFLIFSSICQSQDVSKQLVSLSLLHFHTAYMIL